MCTPFLSVETRMLYSGKEEQVCTLLGEEDLSKWQRSKSTDDSLFDRIRSKRNTPLLLIGVQTFTATLEISMEASQKIENQSTSRPSPEHT